MLILLGLAGNDLFQQTWKVIIAQRTCDLPQPGCQTANFTKFKINSRNLGSTFFAQVRSCGLAVLHVPQFPAALKTSSALSFVVWELYLLRLADRPFAHWAVHVGTLEFQISSDLHTLRGETPLETASSFGRVPSW